MGLKGAMRALSPSVTLRASGAILSLEEKFQGGTGVNLTPAPPEMVPLEVQQATKRRIEVCFSISISIPNLCFKIG
jgi:hypothetical protein